MPIASTMSGPPMVIRLMAEQRKRCLATILSSAESSAWWQNLDRAQQDEFRDQVRSALAIFYDFSRDVLKVQDEDGHAAVRNDLALELIQAVYQQNKSIAERLALA